jgi:AraC-like DNA-binding protein
MPIEHWTMPRHVHHDRHELIVVLAGQIRTRIGGRILLGRRGDVLLYPAGEPHQEESIASRPLETYFVSWQGSLSDGRFLSNFDRDGRIQYLVEWVFELQSVRPSGWQRLANGLLAAALFEYERKAQTQGEQMLLNVQRLVRENLAKPITLDDLAAAGGMSRFHFARRFRQLTGLPPMQFVCRQRLEVARLLLMTTPLPLKAVARQTGFADQYHFSKVFRRQTGCTPSSLRLLSRLTR